MYDMDALFGKKDVLDMDAILGGRKDLLGSAAFRKKLRQAAKRERGFANFARGGMMGVGEGATQAIRQSTRRAERTQKLLELTKKKNRKQLRAKGLFNR